MGSFCFEVNQAVLRQQQVLPTASLLLPFAQSSPGTLQTSLPSAPQTSLFLPHCLLQWD